jgi:hypothetical protein
MDFQKKCSVKGAFKTTAKRRNDMVGISKKSFFDKPISITYSGDKDYNEYAPYSPE